MWSRKPYFFGFLLYASVMKLFLDQSWSGEDESSEGEKGRDRGGLWMEYREKRPLEMNYWKIYEKEGEIWWFCVWSREWLKNQVGLDFMAMNGFLFNKGGS